MTPIPPQRLVATLRCIFLILMFSFASAGEFSVSPIRVDLGAAVRSGAIVVRNDDLRKLSFQMQAMEWTQDSDGKDVYTETQDLVFHPKILTVESDEEGLIRIGTKTATVPVEKAYRLFIEELPSTTKLLDGNAAQINVLIRFGAGVFVAPMASRDSLDIERFVISKRVMSLSARNSGNRHQMVQEIKLKGTDNAGKEIYGLTLGDRYLLAGTAKSYTVELPPNLCAKLVGFEFEFKTDRLVTSRKLTVASDMCN